MSLKLYEILLDYKLLNHVSPGLSQIVRDLEKANKQAKSFQATLDKISRANVSGLNSAANNFARAGATMRNAAGDMAQAAGSFGMLATGLNSGAAAIQRASQSLARSAGAMRSASRSIALSGS